MLEPLGSFRIIATGLVVAMAKLKHGITRARTGCWRFPAVGWLALGCAIVLGHLTAMAQSNPIPLTGGAVTKMITDYQRPYIYAIQAPVSGGLHGNLLFINTTNNSIDKTLAIGINPTDMTINGAENVLYIIDYGYNTTYRVDLNAQTLLSPFHLGTNLSTISGENAGRLIVVGPGQFFSYYGFVNTASGTLVNTPESSPFSDGDGEIDSAGANYYFGTAGSWPPVIAKWQIQGDYLGPVATISVQQQRYVNGYGSQNLILSHDNKRLFYNGNAYDTNLNNLAWLGAEVIACSASGAVVFTATQAFDGTAWLPMAALPVPATVSAVDGNEKSFWYYNSISNTIESLPLSLVQKPVILQQPTNQTVMNGNTAVIGVLAAGCSPLCYAWYFNGTNIAFTATNQINIEDFQTVNAGYYSVVITNIFGSISSASAAVSVSFVPPIFTSQPSNMDVAAGSNCILHASATGSLPISYQWRLNRLKIDGATNPVLNLTHVQEADQGNYDVVAVNGSGSTNSQLGYINVVGLAEALNTSNLDWINGGDVPWQVEFTGAHDGFADLQSGNICSGQNSVLQTTITGPGMLTFWWSINSWAGSGVNYLNFSVNGLEQAQITFITGWLQVTNYLGGGDQMLQWTFTQPIDSAASQAGYVDQVSFVPGGTPPYVAKNPTNQIVLRGSSAALNASALGTPPFNFQWQLNGTNMAGATNAALTIDNAQLSNEGNYTLVVSNAFGTTSTTPAFINVVDFTEAINGTNLVWNTGGDLPWFPETSVSHDGIAALQSGAISGGQRSTVSTTVGGPGTLSFWWKVSSEPNNDYVSFTLDGAEQARNSGQPNVWSQTTIYLTNGTHLLAWDYSKNATINYGTDAAWLDQVSFSLGATPVFIVSNPASLMVPRSSNAVFSVAAQGTPPFSYQWLFNGTHINGATNASLTLNGITWTNDGVYSVVVSNAYGMVTSSNATLAMIRSLVVGWGINSYGQTSVPWTLTNAIGIAAGYDNSMALKADGTVAGWGYDGWQETTPPNGLSNVVAIATSRAAAGAFSLALKADGTVFGWGNNAAKQTDAPAGLSNVVAIAAGQLHGLALRNDGKVFAWGNNYYGQTNVPAALTNATAIAAGYNACLVLRNNGSLVAWGDNTYGQTNIPSRLTNVTAIASGWYHCLALKSDGTITAWGNNSFGQTNVPVGLSNVVAIGVGQYHSLAVQSDGTVVAWGQNACHETDVPSGLNHAVAVAGGFDHSLALMQDGPPVIFTQPLSQTNYAGYTMFLSGNASGLHPLWFQWMLNGTNLIGATNSTFVLANFQPENAGIYSFMVSNALGSSVSSNAIMSVLTNSPLLLLQPTNQTCEAGSDIAFSVTVGAGPIPNIYQWQFNGTIIEGATNAVLTFTNVQATNQGNYAVSVNNGCGMVTSSNAYLTVVVVDLPTALNTPGWTWTTSVPAAWFGETNITNDGFEAAQSGLVPNGKSSALQATVTGPGTLTYWWMFPPLPGTYQSLYPNTLSFSSSQGNASASVYSTAGWQQKTIYLGAGQQTLTWNYSRFPFASPQSTGWVDQVSFTPGGTPPAFTSMSPDKYVRAKSSLALSVVAYGTPPLAYQWQLNGTNLLNQTNASLVFLGAQAADAGIYSVMITNGYGSITTNVTLWVGQFTLNAGSTNLSMATNGFRLTLDGVLTTNPVVVFGSTDLVNWLPVFTNPATTGSVQFLDVTATNMPTRFYRAQQ